MPERDLLGRFPGGPSRARRVLPPALLLAAGALVVGAAAGTRAGTSRGATRSAGGGGALVQRRDLISTDTQSGTLGYADPRTVFNRLSGTITALPQVGRTVKAGGVLFAVDGAPVVLFSGQSPAYRSFASGMSDGPDVAELKRALVGLGFDPGHAITVNNTFDSATGSAIDRWQASLGQTQTGSVTLGQIVFLPGSRRISSVTGVLGSTGPGGGASSGAGAGTTGASYHGAAAGPQFVSLQTTTTATTTTPTTTTPSPTTTTPSPTTTTPTTTVITAPPPAAPRPTPPAGRGSPSAQQLLAELVAELRRLAAGSGSARSGGPGGARSGAGSAGSVSAGGGSAASSGAAGSGSGASSSGAPGASPILSTTSADLQVTVNLDATKQSEAVIGEPVAVQLPDGSSTTGRVTAVSSVAQSSSTASSAAGGGGGGSSTPSATVPVTVALTGHRPVQGLDQAAVSVLFQQQVERGVLSVPVTALLATAGGGYAVQTTGANPRTLAVTVGLFAGGYVQISGSAITEGLPVSNSQG